MANGDTYRVMLVDDEEHLLVALGDFLSFEGFEVTTASSGEEALEKLKTTTPDLIVLDISMPGMSGPAFVGALASRLPRHIPILVFSAVSDMQKCFGSLPVDGYIAKPCSEIELVRRIRGILATVKREGGGAGRQRRVLLVDSETARAEEIRDALRQAGGCAETAANGTEALERTILNRPDLLVMNHTLADMDSKALLALLQGIQATRVLPCLIYGVDKPPPSVRSEGAPETGELRTLAGTDAASVVRVAREMLDF